MVRWADLSEHVNSGRSVCGALTVLGVGEAVGVGAGFDDVATEREPVNDGGAQSWSTR